MILSRKHKCIFIKGQKVAGTSVEIALSSICGPEDIITPISQIDELERLRLGYRPAQNYGLDPVAEVNYLDQLRHQGREHGHKIEQPSTVFYNHMSLREVIAQMGVLSPDWRIFCVERSPYHKVISWAYWVIGYEEYSKTGKTGCFPEKFIAFLEHVIDNGLMSSVFNYDLYLDSEGKLKTQVLNFENLSNDFAAMMRDLGVASPPPLPHAKLGLNANGWSLQDIANLLKKERIAKINDMFFREFECFGFPMIR